MHTVFLILSAVAGIVGFVCWIIVLIDAFQHEIWKGIVGLLCGFYLIYYGFVEFEHEKKWPIVLGMLFSGAISYVLRMM